jgi:hypothetical protein
VASGAFFPEGLESALQRPGRWKKRAIHGLDNAESQMSFVSSRELTHKDFGWVSTWSSTSSSAKHGGRATL